MFCTKCGAQISDGSKFCEACGQPVEETGNAVSTGNSHKDEKKTDITATLMKNKKIVPYVIGAAALLAIILLIGIAKTFSGGSSTKINLNNFIVIDYDGYDGYGNADAYFDRLKFTDKYSKKLDGLNAQQVKKNIKKAQKKDIITQKVYMDMIDSESYSIVEKKDGEELCKLISNCISVKLDKSEKLANGDVINATWSLSEDDLEEYGAMFGLSFESEAVEKKVSGLKKVKQFDPFENIEVSFEGIEPRGRFTFTVINPSSEYDRLHFSIDFREDSELSNNQEVVVYCKFDEKPEEYIDKFGHVPYPTKKTYTVSGLKKYVSSVSEIPQSTIDEVTKIVENAINNEYSSNEDGVVDAIDFIGINIMTPAEAGTHSGLKNMTYFVYRIHATFSGHDVNWNVDFSQGVDYFYTASYRDVLTDDSSNIEMDIDNAELSYNYADIKTKHVKAKGWFLPSYFSFKAHGFSDYDEWYDDKFASWSDQYNTETSVVADDTVGFAGEKFVSSAEAFDLSKEFNGHHYLALSKVTTWEQAKEFCEKMGGHLVTVTDAAEDEFVSGLTQENAYLGASRTDDTTAFTWVTGENFDYTNWYDGQPTYEADYYVGYFASTWADYDAEDSLVSAYICEWDK